MPHRFVSLGECMIELAPAETPGQFRKSIAGDTFNTAWYARRTLPADWTVDYVTAVGDDNASRQMVGFIGEAGIGTDRILVRPDRSVGLYLIELEAGERRFSYWRGQSAARTLAADAGQLADSLDGAAVLYFSGITIAVLEGSGRKTFLDQVARARQEGARVVFDPNLRPRLWCDTATMCAAITEAAGHADIVLPSFDDEAAFFGDADTAATARRYAALGCGLVVVKNGAGEMLTLERGEMQRHPPEPVARVVDTTAAGDSFNAGFLARHLQGAELPDAVRAGARLAAQVIGGRGALVEV